MDTKTCIEKLHLIARVSMAAVGEDGSPQARTIGVMHVEDEKLYFLTARGKPFYHELLSKKKVAVLGLSRYKEMIRLNGVPELLPKEEQSKWLDLFFEENPYMMNVYPGETRQVLEVFCVQSGEIEYFHLGVHPIVRETYIIGNGVSHEKLYTITEDCTGCGMCTQHCPQSCITVGTPYRIGQNHCLRRVLGSLHGIRRSIWRGVIVNEVINNILERRSIRKFKPGQISREELDIILETGLYAPCAGGRQGVIMVACQNREINAELGKINQSLFHGRISILTSNVSQEQPSIADDPTIKDGFYGAPTVITLFAAKDFLYATPDCSVAVENIMLAAHSLGIGSCMIMRTESTFESAFGKQLQKDWGIDESYQAKAFVLLGYPATEPPKAKPRKENRIKVVE